ncbi:MAG TPA: hypothetical protein PK985_08590, partial [Bacillota bacterium]|nr:hypothetical protein [Bacillota bacterium]
MDRKMSRKLIAILTICTMIALMLPAYALADEGVPEEIMEVQEESGEPTDETVDGDENGLEGVEE